MALAFAVAASSNLPAVLLTLYWKRCNTGGVVLGMLVGAFAAIALVLVSPNMSYPLALRDAAQKTVDAGDAKRTAANAALAAASDEAPRAAAQQALDKVDADVGAAQAKLASLGDSRTSIVGLERPLIALRNPGIISIPLGFLCVFLGSLLWRDRRAAERWDELYVRQNTGIDAERAAEH